jgi:hypothetical protein
MCIIAVKPSGVVIPPLQILKNCWENNDNGAGVMYSDNDAVNIRKGFLRWEEFEEFYKTTFADTERFEKSSIVFHFRLATHGSVCAENTHPFPVIDDNPGGLDITTGLAVMHNGVIPNCHDTSKVDTVQLIDGILRPVLLKNMSLLKVKAFGDLLVRATSSKFAFLDNEGTVTLVGAFNQAADGLYYSNDGYKSSRSSAWRDSTWRYQYRFSDYDSLSADDEDDRYDYYDLYVDKVIVNNGAETWSDILYYGECYINKDTVAVSSLQYPEQVDYYLSGAVMFNGDDYFLVKSLKYGVLTIDKWLGGAYDTNVEFVANKEQFNSCVNSYVLWIEQGVHEYSAYKDVKSVNV